jgi:hypothetical protein
MNKEIIAAIEKVLGHSDIVWPKYGSQTIKELANQIATKIVLEKQKQEKPWLHSLD